MALCRRRMASDTRWAKPVGLATYRRTPYWRRISRCQTRVMPTAAPTVRRVRRACRYHAPSGWAHGRAVSALYTLAPHCSVGHAPARHSSNVPQFRRWANPVRQISTCTQLGAAATRTPLSLLRSTRSDSRHRRHVKIHYESPHSSNCAHILLRRGGIVYSAFSAARLPCRRAWRTHSGSLAARYTRQAKAKAGLLRLMPLGCRSTGTASHAAPAQTANRTIPRNR